jgi:hypothetical protein
MSYRLDADILIPSGEVKDKETDHVISPALNIKWKKPDENFYGINEKKT